MSEARAPAPDRALVERKRLVRRLLALEGRVLRLPDGLWILRRGRIVDALAWQAALAAGGDPARRRAALTADALIEPVSRQQLAAASHALAVLDAGVDALTDTPARWLGGQRRDAAWLASLRRRLQRLSDWIATPPRDASEMLCAWFEVESLPPLTTPVATLAWLCDTPPTQPELLEGTALGEVQATLALIAEHGPRTTDTAAGLLLATRSWPLALRSAWWRWLSAGIDPDPVLAWPAGQRVAAAPPPHWSLPAVRVYLQLATALLAHPGATRLQLSPERFVRLADGRQPTLIALASALDQLGAQPGAAEDRLALADVALRLDGRLVLPQAPPTPLGLIAQVDPDYLAWLAAPTLVERYLSLRVALGEPAEISRRLQQDHALTVRAGAERQVLLALPAADPRRARLQSLAAAGDPARTQRRLTAECAQLTLRWRMAAVDQALQAVLARVVGTTLTRWDAAWRDAARLYLGLDQNHAELRALLRAAAEGDADAWRQRLPANRDWIGRQPATLQAGWRDPPVHTWLRRGEACTLTAERDPLQALRMGLPFGSCLAIDDGCNRHSAVINALDVNKWVVYLRDPRGRILARQLLAISRTGGLLGYRIYTSIGVGDGLGEAFDGYARALAAASGVALIDAGDVETLNGSDWYDDGARPWPTATDGGDDERQAYLGELGLTPTGPPAESLAEEARRWAQARAGRVEALPPWGDSRPSAQRNRQLLEARWGRPRLFRMLGPEVAGHYRLELADRSALSTLLRLEAQLTPAHAYRLAQFVRVARPDAEGMRRALRRLHAAEPSAGFDDHGLEHAMLDVLPVWGGQLCFAELADELPTLARALDHLRAGLPEDCQRCLSGCEWQLSQALRRSWRRAPDPARMRRLLQARHPSDTLPRWLLGVAARVHLGKPEDPALFAAPAADRELLRALDHLLDRHPALRADPQALAARLRHSDPDRVDPEHLDWPGTPPWDALGDSIVHWPSLWPALRRYARRPGDLGPLSPAEAHWAHHTPTAWREALAALAATPDSEGDQAVDQLAQIGEAGLLAAARIALARRHPRSRADRRHQQERNARLNHADPDGSLGACWREWQRLGQPGANLGPLGNHPDITALADALLDATEPPAWVRADAPPAWLFRKDADLYARLWQHPAWRPHLDHCRPLAWSAALARQWLRQWPADLGEHWLIQTLRDGATDLLEDGPLDEYQRLAMLAARHCDPAQWQCLYDALPDALAASVFLRARGELQLHDA